MTDYEAGQQDRKGFVNSQGYAGISRNITAEDATLLFWPPITNDMMQVARPMPKDRKEWVEGWNDEKSEED